jgi:hypothetical protein
VGMNSPLGAVKFSGAFAAKGSSDKTKYLL